MNGTSSHRYFLTFIFPYRSGDVSEGTRSEWQAAKTSVVLIETAHNDQMTRDLM